MSVESAWSTSNPDTRTSGETFPSAPPTFSSRRGIVGWIMFDWSMQPFFTLVTIFVFAPYFVDQLASTPAHGQALWGYATSAAGLVIAVFSPVLGAIADASGRRKRWTLAFGFLMVVASTALWFAAPDFPAAVPLVVIAFALGTIGAEFATMFNNAMMPRLVPSERLGRLSGTAWAVGYVGGLISLVLSVGLLAADPTTGKTLIGLDPLFGLDPSRYQGDRITGPLSAVWFMLFVIPMLLFTPDAAARQPLGVAIRDGVAQLFSTFAHARSHRNILKFILANMIYTDGLVALFAFGGIYGSGVFGWSAIELGLFGILLMLTGSLGAFIGGWLDDRIGSRTVIIGSLAFLLVAAAAIISIDRTHLFFVIPVPGRLFGGPILGSLAEQVYIAFGCLIGIAAGPLQASSRTLVARLAPQEKVGQFFGLFALSGKVTSFCGPLAVGLVTDLTMSQRQGMSVLLVFFLIGLVLIAGVKTGEAE